jgi:hypothetical protein
MALATFQAHCDNFWIPDAAQFWALWIRGIH